LPGALREGREGRERRERRGRSDRIGRHQGKRSVAGGQHARGAKKQKLGECTLIVDCSRRRRRGQTSPARLASPSSGEPRRQAGRTEAEAGEQVGNPAPRHACRHVDKGKGYPNDTLIPDPSEWNGRVTADHRAFRRWPIRQRFEDGWDHVSPARVPSTRTAQTRGHGQDAAPEP